MNTNYFLTSFILVIALAVKYSYAQSDRKLYDSMAADIQVHYNARQPEKIYSLTSSVFRKKMTPEQFALGMSKFSIKAGKWNTCIYAESNEKGMDYHAEFENSLQIFSIKLDDEGKISRLNFSPMPVTIAPKSNRVPDNNPLLDTLDKLVEKLVRPYIQKGNTAGLALAVINNGEIRTYSYGTVNKADQHLPDPEKTIFEIGSVTKTFTSLLLAKEVVSGRMKLDDPINLYLPDTIPALHFQGHPITLKQLANHTSGLPRLPGNIFIGNVDARDPYKHYPIDSLFSFLKHYRPSARPGTVFSYSNFGAGVLGTLLERQRKCSFGKLIDIDICKPLGMKHTGITLNAPDQENFAQGYNEKGEATLPWNLAALQGSGAIQSTLNDMVVYVRSQLGMNNPLKKAMLLSHQPTFESKEQIMGLGWRITVADKRTYLHHSGGTGGFRSFVGFEQDKQFGIVILSNAAEDVTAIGEEFFKNILPSSLR